MTTTSNIPDLKLNLIFFTIMAKQLKGMSFVLMQLIVKKKVICNKIDVIFADCGDVPFINDGNIFLQEEGNSSYGALAKVTCNTGYNTTSDTIQCLDTGEWDNRTCTIVGL
jgi:hypothetical protein